MGCLWVHRTRAVVSGVFAVCMFAAVSQVQGGPVSGEPCTLAQPDGLEFVARPGGDEWFNWISHKGVLITQNERGWWCYARLENGVLQAGHSRAGRDAPTAAAVTLEDLPALAGLVERPRNTHAPEPLAATRAANRDVLVILVEFTDQTFATTDAYWQNAFFGAAGKTVRTYYDEVSGGNLTLVPVPESFGTANDGVVRVQLNYAHPNPDSAIDDFNRWITHDGLVAADPFVAWPALDLDSDTYLTPQECHIAIVVAGHEAGYGSGHTPAVWGHRWALGFTHTQFVPAPQLQGVHLCDSVAGAGYTQTGELHATHAGSIGVPCHELAHDMGLIDLYDTTLNSDGIGGHGLMGYGPWGQAAGDTHLGETPTHMCAWSKAQLGFVTPAVAAGNQDHSLHDAGSWMYNAVRVNTTDVNQYFLIENRQLSGFDEGLYRWFSITSGGAGGGGLAIWHIDESIADNNSETRKKVDLEEANEGILGWSELDYRPPYPQDPVPYQGNLHHFYYAGHVADFTKATTPDSEPYGGSANYLAVSSVSVGGATMKCFVATQPSSTRILEWSTFLGGSAYDQARGVSVDSAGNIYVGGTTASANFPTTSGAYDTTLSTDQASFVSKFSSSGSLVYSTLVETGTPTGRTNGYGVAADAAGNAYVTGGTTAGFPITPGAYDSLYSGSLGEGYVAKLDAAGANLVYATYLGGTEPAGGGQEFGMDVAVDTTGNACVIGYTTASDFPYTHGSSDSTVNTFAVKLYSDGTGVHYAWLLSGEYGGVWGWGVTLDNSGAAYIAGITAAADYPTTTGAYDTTHNGGNRDAFFTKLGPTGSFDYSTYLGGSSEDYGYDVDVDASGYAYIGGYTASANFPTTTGVIGPAQVAGSYDVFVTKLHPTAYSGLAYSTYLGGSGTDEAYGIAVDSNGSACVAAGITASTDYPLEDEFFSTNSGSGDAFQTVINADATAIDFSTYLGGSLQDRGYDIVLDAFDAMYIVGATSSADYPTTAGAYDTTNNGGSHDAFISKIGWAQVLDSLVVGSPDGGEILWITGNPQISWSSSGAAAFVDVELSRGGYGGPWETLFSATANDGSETWAVNGPASSNCAIRITDTSNGNLTDVSNATFTISPYIAGDLDCDGNVSSFDVSPFGLALTDPAAYMAAHPGCSIYNADINGDGNVDGLDIAPFMQLLMGG